MSVDVGPGGDPEKMNLIGPDMSQTTLFPENFSGITEIDNRVIGSGEGYLSVGEAWRKINRALGRPEECDTEVTAEALKLVLDNPHITEIRQSVTAVVDLHTNCLSQFPGPLRAEEAA